MKTEQYDNPVLKAFSDIFSKVITLAIIVLTAFFIAGFIKALYHIVMLPFGKKWPEDFPKAFGYLAIPFFLFVLWFLFGFGDQHGFIYYFKQAQPK